jgi:predicted molibdopterin-dependent oxidoreductase YjgC
VIVQDCFRSPLWERADYQAPGATFAEREGSYVNAGGRLQSFRWSIRPPTGIRTEGQLYWQLLQKPGMYQATVALEEIAREMAYFAAAAGGVSDVGVDLRVNQIA